MTTALIIFAKYPQAGKVKTRLAATIGEQQACALYREFVRWFLQRMLRTDLFDEIAFAVSPQEQLAGFEKLFPGADAYVAQNPARDLGGRMDEVMRLWRARGFQRVLITGTDSPNLPIAYLQQAVEALSRHDVVFGPADDGGYYLVGQSKPVAGMFDDINWSTETVLQESVEKLLQSGTSYHLLPAYYDIDDIEGLRRLDEEAPGVLARAGVSLPVLSGNVEM